MLILGFALLLVGLLGTVEAMTAHWTTRREREDQRYLDALPPRQSAERVSARK